MQALYWAVFCFTCRKPVAVERATWSQDRNVVHVANPAKLPDHFYVKCPECGDSHDYKLDLIYEEVLPIMLNRDTKLVSIMAVPEESNSTS